MKSLAIYVVYDKDGIVDKYIFRAIEELQLVCNELIVVVNGSLEKQYLDSLCEVADLVIVRENKGFDAGAYADVIIHHIGKEKIGLYNTIILCNDTFYGPFSHFVDIFNYMKEGNYDYWGIDYINRDFLSYIVTYFCVFEGNTIISEFLYEYLEKNIINKIEDIHDAFARFEVGLTFFARKQGYRVGSYCNSCGVSSSRNPDICCIKHGLPIWKKKFFDPQNYQRSISENLLAYIRDELSYDINEITESVKRKYGVICDGAKKYDAYNLSEIKTPYSIPNISYTMIQEFINDNDDIYIYGTGSFGKATYYIFKNIIKNFKGFISTNKVLNKVSGLEIYNPTAVSSGAGVIIALNEEHTKEIIPIIDKLKKSNRVLLWWDIKE